LVRTKRSSINDVTAKGRWSRQILVTKKVLNILCDVIYVQPQCNVITSKTWHCSVNACWNRTWQLVFNLFVFKKFLDFFSFCLFFIFLFVSVFIFIAFSKLLVVLRQFRTLFVRVTQFRIWKRRSRQVWRHGRRRFRGRYPEVNFTIMLQTVFAPIFLHQKITKPNCN